MPVELAFTLILALAGREAGRVHSYEALSLPEHEGWTLETEFDIERWVDGGYFFERPRLCDGCPGPAGELENHRMSLATFAGAEEFFIEWRMQTTGPAYAINATAPAGLATANQFGILYHFTTAVEQVRFIRDLPPNLYVDIEPGVFHRYRLDLQGADWYSWRIDGQVVDEGTPEGAFPTDDGTLVFWTRRYGEDPTTQWDYIRFGIIPHAGTGDFDSDSDIDDYDLFLFVDYMTPPGGTHLTGWSVGDMEPTEGDADIDLADFAEFQNVFTSDK